MRILWALSLLFCSTVFAEQKEQQAPAKNIEALKQQISKLMEHHAVPGAAVAIVDKQSDRLVTGLGFANKDKKIPASAETLFRIGSTSKMFVSLAALKLKEQGQIDFNATVKSLAPEVEFNNPWEETHPVRFIHLLEHTTGWDDIHLPEYAHNDPTPVTLKQAIDYHPDSRTSRWRPGERMSYSNSGPPVAAYIIQKIAGVDFEQYVKEHFFSPLEMDSATYRYPENDNLRATLYEAGKESPYWHIGLRPSGAINASARDMAGLLRFFIHRGTANGERILSEKSIQQMEIPSASNAARSGLKTGYALSNYSSFYQQFVFRGHNGGVNGGLSDLSYLPQQGVGFVLIINSGSGTAFKEISNAIKAYITYSLAVPKNKEAQPLEKSIMNNFSGYFMAVNPRNEKVRFIDQILNVKQVSFSDNKLTFADSKADEFYLYVGNNQFRRNDRSVASLILLEDSEGKSIQVGTQYYQQVSATVYWLKLILLWSFAALIVAHLIWFWVWLVRWLSKKIPSGAAIQIRIWPFLASLSVVVFMGGIILGGGGTTSEVFDALGQPSLASISIMVSSYLFAVFSVLSLIQNLRYFKTNINTVARYFNLITSIVFVVATLYLFSFGVIGMQTYG